MDIIEDMLCQPSPHTLPPLSGGNLTHSTMTKLISKGGREGGGEGEGEGEGETDRESEREQEREREGER